MNERTIDLRDLFYKILYRWKLILVAMIIGGVIFGVYGYISVQKDREELVGDTGKNYLMDLTEEEAERVAYFIEYEKQYNVAKENFENSVIQKLDTSNIYTLDNVYTVACDDKDRAFMLVKAYEQCLESNGFYEKIAKVYGGIEAKDVKNLFIVKKDNDGTNNYKMTFAISFMADDEKVCKVVNDVVKEYVEGLNEKFNETYGIGNVNLMSSQISNSGSSEILAKKMEELTNYEIIKNKYFELKNGVSKEQVKIYEKNEVKTSVMTYISKVVIGIIVFGLIMVVIIAIKYVANKSVKTTMEIQETYKLPLLGVIKKSGKDNLIQKFEQRKEKFLEENEVEDIICTQILMSVKKENVAKIALVNNGSDGKMDKICMELVLKLRKKEINTTVVNDMLNVATDMLEISGVDGAVILINLGSTKSYEIENELGILERQDKRVIGYIAVK